MMKAVRKKMLTQMRDLAKEKIESGNEPPVSWILYWELIKTIDAILSGIGSATFKRY